jgi:hypothetical protein
VVLLLAATIVLSRWSGVGGGLTMAVRLGTSLVKVIAQREEPILRISVLNLATVRLLIIHVAMLVRVSLVEAHGALGTVTH